MSRVAYFYDYDTGNHYYGMGHPMKPQRLQMTHNLLINYGMCSKMKVYKPHSATFHEMTQFHSKDYVDFLRRVTPDWNVAEILKKFNLGEYTDCPVFEGIYKFCQLYTGASIDGAMKLNNGQVDIAVNWAGGLHHAKKCEASGFCYVNDIVIAILELLKYHPRVLYIDIDIHHGDGVEEAFYTTDRVMTVSFHKYGDFFPGTGDVVDVGDNRGKYYSVNFPLQAGVDDESYLAVFKPIISKVIEIYRPSAVVLQCGADSVTGDRLGCFNLTVKGHGECVEFVKSFGLPLLVLGGGGYNIRNVSRAWTYETSVLLNEELPNNIPFNDYFQYYAPEYNLHLNPADMTNTNDPKEMVRLRDSILQNLGYLEHAPSVQMHQVPSDFFLDTYEEWNPDFRLAESEMSESTTKGEYYRDDKDQDTFSTLNT